jgi:hypothetical protein
MAKAPDIAPRGDDGQRVSASTWALIATLAGSALLLYTGVMTGEWRGVVVSELQILVVGLTTALVLRGE